MADDDRIDLATAAQLLGGERPMATCRNDGEPLVATTEFRGYEFVCVVCGSRYGFLAPKPATSTPELQARHADLQARYDHERANRSAYPPIENTADRAPIEHVAGMVQNGSSAYIGDMEAQGQRELIASDRLPVQIMGTADDTTFEQLGFTFGPPDPADPLFRPATLPAGWTRRASDHDMWSYIVDADGVDQVAIFYKAAFYDRSAFMRLA